MSSFTAHLVRRGTELASAHLNDPEKQPQLQIPVPLAILLIVTTLAFVVTSWAIGYTYYNVVATLAAVEDSNPDVYVRIDNPRDEDPVKPFNPDEPELAAMAPSPQPITNKLRTTISHLRARAGFWSRFRGVAMYWTVDLARAILTGLLPIRFGSFIGQFFTQSIISVLLATWYMAWVHIVISEPSPKRFYQRIPSWRTWTKIAPAALLQDGLTAAALYLPVAFAEVAGWLVSGTEENVLIVVWGNFLTVAIPILIACWISIPARVIFIRVAASMLPEEDEAIVPFDRSFGGKVQPEIVGGSGRIGLLDAWTTFDWAGRVRFVKVIAKTFAMETALGLFFGLLVVGEILIFMPEAFTRGGLTKPPTV